MPPEPFPLRLAVAWTLLITAGLWFGLSAAFVAFPHGRADIVVLGLTQVAVYAVVLGAFRFARGTPFAELLALRRTSLGVCSASAALGAALQIPATLLSEAIEHFYPTPPAVLLDRISRITPHSTWHGLAIFAVVAGLGPCVEEFFFRGALYGTLRRGHGARVTSLVVSICFTLGHLDVRLLLPLFMAALALAHVREHSGSIWPGLALHAAFNAVTLQLVFAGAAPQGKPPPMPILLAISGCLASVLLLWVVRELALSSPVAQNARNRDQRC